MSIYASTDAFKDFTKSKPFGEAAPSSSKPDTELEELVMPKLGANLVNSLFQQTLADLKITHRLLTGKTPAQIRSEVNEAEEVFYQTLKGACARLDIASGQTEYLQKAHDALKWVRHFYDILQAKGHDDRDLRRHYCLEAVYRVFMPKLFKNLIFSVDQIIRKISEDEKSSSPEEVGRFIKKELFPVEAKL